MGKSLNSRKVETIGKSQSLKPCASRYFQCLEAEGVPKSTSNRFLATPTFSALQLTPGEQLQSLRMKTTDVIVKAKSTLSQTNLNRTIAAFAIGYNTGILKENILAYFDISFAPLLVLNFDITV